MTRPRISANQTRDTGLALTLVLLVVGYMTQGRIWVAVAIATLLTAMVVPAVYRPLAIVWFGLAEVLSRVVTTILLSAVFFLLVTPVGLVRKMMGADPLQRKSWRSGTGSVMRIRDHAYTSTDINRPY